MKAPVWSALKNLTEGDTKPLDYLDNRSAQRAEKARERGYGLEESKKSAIIHRLTEALRGGTNGFRTIDKKSAVIITRNHHEDSGTHPWQATFCWLNAEGAIEAMEYDQRFPNLALAVLYLVEEGVIIPQERFELKLRIWPENVSASLTVENFHSIVSSYGNERAGLQADTSRDRRTEGGQEGADSVRSGSPQGLGSQDADALRNRIVKARQGRASNLRARGHEELRPDEEAGPLKSSRFQKALQSAGPIESLTIPQLRDAEDPAFLKKGQRRMELTTPMFKRVYASTVEYATKSSKYIKNKTIYTQKILFRDFYVIARDKQIPMADAIRYAIENADVHVRCSCPSFLYHGFAYIDTQLGALYGLPREGRFPEVQNPGLRSVYCKHLSRVLEQIMRNENVLVEKFSAVYNRKPTPGVPETKPSQPAPAPEVPQERVKVSDV